MQKYKVKKEVVQQVTSKLNANKVVEKTLFNINWEEILKSHKYSRKEFKNGKWIFYYDKHNNHARMTQCKSSLLNISYDKTLDPEIQTAMITDQAIDYIENVWLADWEKSGNENKSICKELRNKKIIFGDISYTHLWKQGGNSQNGARIKSPKNIMEHVPYLPCAKELLEDNGVWIESRYEPINKKHSRAVGIIYQTLSGISPIGSPKPYVSVTISQYKYKNGKKGDALYISVVGKDDIKKSLDKKNGIDLSEGGNKSFATKAAFCLTSPKSKPNLIIQKSNNMSSKIKSDYDGHNVLHKSLDITVTDITENNKQKKIEQVEKSLNAMADNIPFVIKHIATDDSKKYDNITLRIKKFDKSKIEKAVRSLSFSLNEPLKAAKGEVFTYKCQEELTNRIVQELTNKTREVYQFVINYFGLPEMTIVQKAYLQYKGKIIFNPETGKPVKKSDWKKFVEALEKLLTRYNGTGEKIVLSAQSLGMILERLSKTNSIEAIKKMKLDDIKYNHRSFDWISESVKNMTNIFGETLTRDRQARVQAAIDSAAQRVTRVTNDLRDNIQQIILDGIKDKQSKSKISQNLFDKCVGMNRDIQKITDSEIQNNTTSAYINEEVYNTKDGIKVYFKRFEVVDDNTCKKCKALKDKIVLFSDKPLESENIKDEYTDKAIWEGKQDGIPFSISHPYCRGTWFRYYPELD